MIGRAKIKKSIATHRLLTLGNIEASTAGLNRSVHCCLPDFRKHFSWFEKSSFVATRLNWQYRLGHNITIVCYHFLVHASSN